MVVQCTNCRAKFRVADEKVPERGVKVRCTKCSTVFKVTKADAVDAKPAGGAPPNPFGFDSGRTTPTPPDEDAAPPRETTNPYANLGQPAPRPTPTPQLPTGGRVVPYLPQAVSLTYGAASPHQSLDLDLSLGPPSPTSGALAPVARPPPGSMMSAQQLAPPSPSAAMLGLGPPPMRAPSALDAAMAGIGSDDPFADMGVQQAPPPLPPRPNGAVDPFAVLNPPPSAPVFDDPFAIDMGGSPQAPDMMQDPSAPTGQTLQSFAAPPQTPQAAPQQGGPNDPWANLLRAQPKREETDPFANLDSPQHSPPPSPPPPPREAGPPTSQQPGPASEPPQRQRAGSGPGLRPTEPGANEFEFGEATRGHKLDLDYGPGQELELSTPQSQPDARREREKGREKEKEKEKDGVEIGRLGLKGQKTQVPVEEKPKVDPKAVAKSRFRRELASSVFNVLSACVVFYAGIVAIAWIRTPRAIGFDDLGFPMVWLAFGGDSTDPAEQLRATDIHTGIYPTYAGNEVFYVQGLATNTSEAKHDSLHAVIDVTRGDHVVAHAESLALLPNPPDAAEDVWPERLWALDSRDNLDLQKVLTKQTPSLVVDPHKSAPFIAVFRLTAKEVEGCDVRVTIKPGIPPALHAAVSPDAVQPPKPGDKPADKPAEKSPQTADARPKVP